MAELGAEVIRICLMWADFQPEPRQMNTAMLDELEQVLDIAEETGLDVMPTFFTGNMSGAIWLPAWALSDRPHTGKKPIIVNGHYADREPRNLFADAFMLKAQVYFIDEVVGRFCGHEAICAWDLGNEIDGVVAPGSYDNAWLWARILSQAIKAHDTRHPITYGAHPPSLTQYGGLALSELAPNLDFLSIHGYPLYSEVARSPVDPDFAPFVTELAAALGGKPALMQEFGACTAPLGKPTQTITDDFLGELKPQVLLSEEEEAAYYATVLPRLYQVGALGALAWCYTDYSPSLWTRPPLDRAKRERTFGLVRTDRSLKPAAEVFRTFARELADGTIESHYGPWGKKRHDLAVQPEEYYRSPEEHFRKEYERYIAAPDS
jgi:beta-galactosidase